ncbi:MAG: HD-GYP domain-containing protein [Armatimonadetes bacterium]|nr:HD-GYP domain-containing protein [Armatimonadota bacterium]
MSDKNPDNLNTYSKPLIKNKFISKSKMIRDAYDGNGLLLLSAGTFIDETLDVDRLKGKDVQFSQTKFVRSPQGSTQTKSGSIMPPDAPDAPESAQAVREQIQKRTEEAKVLREETTVAVESIFERALYEDVHFEDVYDVVSPLVTEIVNDSRMLLSLVNLKNADAYTFTHSVNVATITTALAIKSGNSDRLEETAIGAMMHDIGKSATPNSILNKPGSLNAQELAVIRQHPAVGASILMKSGGFSPWIINAVMDHHESFAGKGYPRSRKGSQIGMPARMISIADVYDALTTTRPYRAALSPKVAISMMMEKMCDSFDPFMLSTFISLIGYYPTGSIIELNNGCKAQILMVDPNNLTSPAIVEVIEDSNGNKPLEPFVVDLRVQKSISMRTDVDEPNLEELSPLITREFHPFEAYA